ncbi:hypothetical protein V9Y78_05085 [Klebsiella pneumoniae]
MPKNNTFTHQIFTGIRALVYVSLVSVAIWGATGYLVMEAVRAL